MGKVIAMKMQQKQPQPTTGTKPRKIVSENALIKRINRAAKRPSWKEEIPEENIFGGDNAIVLKMQGGELKRRARVLCQQKPSPRMRELPRVSNPEYLLLNFHDLSFAFMNPQTLEKAARALGVLAKDEVLKRERAA